MRCAYCYIRLRQPLAQAGPEVRALKHWSRLIVQAPLETQAELKFRHFRGVSLFKYLCMDVLTAGRLAASAEFCPARR